MSMHGQLREERGPRGWFYSSDEVASGRQDSSRVRSARSEWLWVARPRTWSKCMGAPLRAAFRLRSELLLPRESAPVRPREHDVPPSERERRDKRDLQGAEHAVIAAIHDVMLRLRFHSRFRQRCDGSSRGRWRHQGTREMDVRADRWQDEGPVHVDRPTKAVPLSCPSRRSSIWRSSNRRSCRTGIAPSTTIRGW